MSEPSAQTTNNPAPAEKITEKQQLPPKSPFTPDESSFKNFLATSYKKTLNKTASQAEQQAEVDSLKLQLETAKSHYEQQKQEAESCKKQLEEAELKLKSATSHICQRITSNNSQCTKTAHKAIKYNGLIFWICKQHLKQYPDAETESA